MTPLFNSTPTLFNSRIR